MSEGQQQKKRPSAPVANKGQNKSAPVMPGLDIFGALTYERKQKKESIVAKAPVDKKNGGVVNNSKSKIQVATYSQRHNRGQTRAIYNEGVTKISG